MNLDRLFLSKHNKCLNGCKYCFADWNIENDFKSISEISEPESPVIMYPLCDSEALYQSSNYIEYLKRKVSAFKYKTVISISTKNLWDDAALYDIVEFNKQSIHKIKLCVSVSCKTKINELEPRSASYEQRRHLLNKISLLNIPTNVLIKPILPFISLSEYKSIIDDFIPICSQFVIGDLYVHENSEFYKSYISGKHPTFPRYSSWLNKNVLVSSHENRNEILSYIKQLGGFYYESDEEYIRRKIM